MTKFSNHSKQSKTASGALISGPRTPFGTRNTGSVDGISGQVTRPKRNMLDDFNKPEGFSGRISPKLTDTSQYALPQNGGSRRLASGGRRLRPNNLVNPVKKPRKALKITLRMGLIVGVAVLLMGGYLFGKAWWNAHRVFQGGGTAMAFDSSLDPNLLTGEGNGRVNILMVGKAGTGRPDNSPDLTDSLMIVSLDPINKNLKLLSIPRDLWVEPDNLWSMKINEVYARTKWQALDKNPDDENAAEVAGLNALSDKVEEYMGIPINYYGLMDFTVLEEVVNTLGGVTVTLQEDYYDGMMIIGGQPLYLEAGPHELDGGVALAYARSRHGSAVKGDFSRGENQQAVLLAIKDKAISIGTFANPMKISGLLDAFGDRVRTNLSTDDMMKVYNLIKDISSENIKNYTLADDEEAVVATGNVNGQSVVYPKAGTDNYDEVRSFVRNKLKDGFITKENPSIIVLNGTSQPGKAQEKANELISYGYNVVQVADAPISVESSKVIDKTNGAKPYTIRYMELRYKTKAVDSIAGLPLDTYQADFIVVVGP